MNTTFAIIGTAGRKEDGNRLTKAHFDAMCECARILLKEIQKTDYEVDTLVSGGAAWADHVAVRLFLNKEVPKLKLFFPTQFLMETQKFDASPLNEHEQKKGYTTGGVANSYHERFSKTCGWNSLHELKFAIQQGAEVYVPKGGFFGRNWLVAQSDIILAMTFGDKEFVKDGGTADTIRKYLQRAKKLGFFDKSWHYDLNSDTLHAGARVKEVDNLV